MISRRSLLTRAAGASALAMTGCSLRPARGSRPALLPAREWVNDVHSQLNPTLISNIVVPADEGRLRSILVARRPSPQDTLSICGGRHAGGGQQFLSGGTLLDMSRMSAILSVDAERGLIKAQAGIRWPALYEAIHQHAPGWAVHQKQGGADEISLGGSASANAHGRCLAAMPMVQDIEELELMDPEGKRVRCSRQENPELFRHVIGGYGMFGVICSVTLRLVKRRKLVKRVQWIDAANAVGLLEAAAARGAVHGDFQYAVDETAVSFMREGLLSWYEPAEESAPVDVLPPGQAAQQFAALVTLAHADKPRALALYREAMLATDGQVNWSDSWQAGDYVVEYHRLVEQQIGTAKGSEILSEIYVPRADLAAFLVEAAEIVRDRGARLIYGTVRLIERDDVTALAWAKQNYACVIFNLHTDFEQSAIDNNAVTFRQLLDAAIARGGSYYLTYHRFARPDQVLACYPQLPAVLREKERLDPRGRIQSDWYRHYRGLL